MPTQINPAAWFWRVGTQIYSSERNTYVSSTDAAYVAWKAANGTPPAVANEAEIWPAVSGVLPGWLFDGSTFSQPTATTYTKPQLKAYAALRRFAKETGGITAAGKPVQTDRASQAMINGAYNMALRSGSFSTKWKAADGSFAPLDAAGVISVATAIGDHVASCFGTEASVCAQIDAGTITSRSQIDTAFA